MSSSRSEPIQGGAQRRGGNKNPSKRKKIVSQKVKLFSFRSFVLVFISVHLSVYLWLLLSVLSVLSMRSFLFLSCSLSLFVICFACCHFLFYSILLLTFSKTVIKVCPAFRPVALCFSLLMPLLSLKVTVLSNFFLYSSF